MITAIEPMWRVTSGTFENRFNCRRVHSTLGYTILSLTKPVTWQVRPRYQR